MDNVLFLVAISTWFDDGENHILCVCVCGVHEDLSASSTHDTLLILFIFSLHLSLPLPLPLIIIGFCSFLISTLRDHVLIYGGDWWTC